MVLFGFLERHAIAVRTPKKQQAAAAFLLEVYHDLKKTTAEVKMWGAFAAIGFTHDIVQNPHRLLFDEEEFRYRPGFAELWDRNVPLESLPKISRESKFGWINKPE
jgi:hypothetical protein